VRECACVCVCVCAYIHVHPTSVHVQIHIIVYRERQSHCMIACTYRHICLIKTIERPRLSMRHGHVMVRKNERAFEGMSQGDLGTTVGAVESESEVLRERASLGVWGIF